MMQGLGQTSRLPGDTEGRTEGDIAWLLPSPRALQAMTATKREPSQLAQGCKSHQGGSAVPPGPQRRAILLAMLH